MVIAFSGREIAKNYLAKVQLKAVANTLATDIVYLQQKNLFDGDNKFYIMEAESEGYSINSNKACLKRVNFAEMGCGNVYMNQFSVRIAFSNNGRPKGSKRLEVRHKMLKDLYYEVAIEPVTGRVVVHEKQ